MENNKKCTIRPTIYEQQIILTCKGHNKNDNNIMAIRYILAQQFGMETKYLYSEIIYQHLLKLVKKYANYRNIDDFLFNLFHNRIEINILDAINDLISILSSIEVFDDSGFELIHLEKNQEILDWKE